MTHRAPRVAWGLFGASILLKICAVALVLAMRVDQRPADGFAFLIWTPGVVAFAIVGALIAARRPGNAIGWIFLAVGVAEPVFLVAEQYSRIGTIIAPGSLPGAGVAGVFSATTSSALMFGILLTGLLFPTGHLPSRRWRPVLALSVAWLGVVVASTILAAGPISETLPVANPAAAPGAVGTLAADIRLVADSAGAVLLMFTAPALIIRWRRSEGSERAQLAWLVYAIAVLLVTVAVVVPIYDLGLLGPITPSVDIALSALLVLAVAGLPVAAGIAILRHRLYDIDVVVRRTVVYAVLVAILGAVYVAVVLALQAVLAGLTGNDTLPVALSTLVIAALFGPVRGRVRAAVDRRFFRSQYDAQRTLEDFSARVRDEVELDAVGRTLLDVAGQAVRPASAGVWLRPVR